MEGKFGERGQRIMKPNIRSKYIEEFLETGKIGSLGIIDAHTHMDGIKGASSPCCDIDGCVKLMDEENIEYIWCAPHSDMFGGGNFNANIKKYIAKYPNRVKAYYSFVPAYHKEYESQLEETFKNKNFIGIKVLPEYHHTALESEEYDKALKFADDNRFAFLCHTWGISPCNHPRNVKKVLERYGNVQFIAGHSAPGALDEVIEMAKVHKNLILDICDIHRNNGVIAKMCREVGSERVVFGTDLPWYDPNYAVGSVLFADITDADRENILRNTALSILNKMGR